MNIKTAPLWKWILMVLLSVFLSFFGYGLIYAFQQDGKALSWLSYVLPPLAILGLYVLFVRWFEKEWAPDVVNKRAVVDLLAGLGFGAAYLFIVAGIMWLCGCCTFKQIGWDADAQLRAFLMFWGVAVGEEVIFRGVVFKWIDKRWGIWVATIISGFIFGFVHLTNTNGTVWSSIAIAIEAGLLFAALYKWSGSLWLPIGVHWSWNYTQGNILGFAVSGNDAGSTWLQVVPDGPDILTGGAFGAEASLISVILGLALTVLILSSNRCRAWRGRP